MLEWMDQSACREYDPDLFFLRHRDGAPNPDPKEEARERREADHLRKRVRQVCRGCPVQEECFWDAMLRPDKYGMRAGMTPREQAKVREQHPKEIEARKALLSRVA